MGVWMFERILIHIVELSTIVQQTREANLYRAIRINADARELTSVLI